MRLLFARKKVFPNVVYFFFNKNYLRKDIELEKNFCSKVKTMSENDIFAKKNFLKFVGYFCQKEAEISPATEEKLELFSPISL